MSPLTAAPSSENLLLGKGELFFNRQNDDGTYQGYKHMGNVETFELTTTDDVIEKYSSMNAAAGLYKRVTRKRDAVLRVISDEFTPENLALITMGEKNQTAAQAATAIVGEQLALLATPGAYYRTAKLGPVTGVAVKDAATALVAGTDYVIANADIGIIQIKADYTPGAGPLTIDYTPTAYADGLTQVRGGTKTNIEGALLFIPDPTTGPKMMVEVWSVSIAPDGALGFISDDFATLGLQMSAQADNVNHPDEPYYLITYIP